MTSSLPVAQNRAHGVDTPESWRAFAEVSGPARGWRSRVLDVATVAISATVVIAAVTWLWRSPWLLTAALLPPLLFVSLRSRHLGRSSSPNVADIHTPERAMPCVVNTGVGAKGNAWVFFAISGLLLGPLTEISCVAAGLWAYTDTGGFPLVPPWILPLWASLPAALWLLAHALLGSGPRQRVPHSMMLYTLGGLAAEVALFALLGDRVWLMLALALALALALLLRFPHGPMPNGERRHAAARDVRLVFFLTGLLLGPLCESLPIAAGAWTYTRTQLLGMPLWLPVGYGIFATLVGLFAEAFGAALSPATRGGGATHGTEP